MWFGAQLYKEGLLSDPPMFQMCLGYLRIPATTLAMQAMKDIMPKEGVWSGFAISKMVPFVAQTVLMGGNKELDLKITCIYLREVATNAQLVEKAIRSVDELGYSPMTPAETREKLKLVKHSNVINKKVAVIGTGVIGTGWIIRYCFIKIVYAFDKDIKLKKNLISEIKGPGHL